MSSPNNNSIKLLFFSSSPKSKNNYDYESEARSLEDELAKSIYPVKIEVKREHKVAISELGDIVIKHKPHIIHFSGHGSEDGKMLFEDDSGEPVEVPKEILQTLFRELATKINILCVLFIACYSKQQAKKISPFVGCVVCTNNAIPLKRAIKFTKEFYKGIGYDENFIKTKHLNIEGAKRWADIQSKLDLEGDYSKTIHLIHNKCINSSRVPLNIKDLFYLKVDPPLTNPLDDIRAQGEKDLSGQVDKSPVNISDDNIGSKDTTQAEGRLQILELHELLHDKIDEIKDRKGNFDGPFLTSIDNFRKSFEDTFTNVVISIEKDLSVTWKRTIIDLRALNIKIFKILGKLEICIEKQYTDNILSNIVEIEKEFDKYLRVMISQ